MAALTFEKCQKARIYDPSGKMATITVKADSIGKPLEGVWKKWLKSAVVFLRTTADFGVRIIAPSEGLTDNQRAALKADISDHFRWLQSGRDGAEGFKPAEDNTRVVYMGDGSVVIWPGKDPGGDATVVLAEVAKWAKDARYAKPTAGDAAEESGRKDFAALLRAAGGAVYEVAVK